MERPNTILGLSTHLARMKWQALSPRARTAVVIVATVLGASGALAVRAATCDGACCSSGCPSAHASPCEH